ncbi:unnamed protein product [Sphagnum tenellum]
MMALMLMVLSLKEASLMPWSLIEVPDTLASDVAAPPFCAGVTVYSPMMRHHMNQAGKSLGVIGLGGLGHMAVKFGKAFGLHVTVLSTSLAKDGEALCILGADAFIVSKDEAAMRGRITIVSAPPEMKFTPVLLLTGLKTISGSMIGGMKEDLQEIILFANLLNPPLSRQKFTRANPFSHHCGGTFLIKNLTHKPFYCCCWRCS